MATIRVATSQKKLIPGVLIGGPEDLWRDLRQKISDEYGIDLEHHDERPKAGAINVPRNAKVVVVLADFTSKVVQKNSGKAGIPRAIIGRKRSTWQKGFRLAGFSPVPQPVPDKWLSVVAASEAKDSTDPVLDEFENEDLGKDIRDSESQVMIQRTSDSPGTVANQEDMSMPYQAVLPLAPVSSLPQKRGGAPGRSLDHEEEALFIQVLKENPNSAEGVIRDLIRIGRFRSPGAITLMYTYNPRIHDVMPVALRQDLARLQKQMDARKNELIKRESELPESELPEWITKQKVSKILGGNSRISWIKESKYDYDLGYTRVYRTSAVLALRDKLLERAGDMNADLSTVRLGGMSYTDDQICGFIIDALTEGPKPHRTLKYASKTSNALRFKNQLAKLMDAGQVAVSEIYGGAIYYHLPEHKDKLAQIEKEKRERKSAAQYQAAATLASRRSEAPAQVVAKPMDPVLQASIGEIMNKVVSGQLNHTKGAEMIAELRRLLS